MEVMPGNKATTNITTTTKSTTRNSCACSACLPSSPCLSQRSSTTSTTISTTTTSSGVCCELDGSNSEEVSEEEIGGMSDDERRRGSRSERRCEVTLKHHHHQQQQPRVEGRKEQKVFGIGSSTTLPARGRRAQRMNPPDDGLMLSSSGGGGFGSNQCYHHHKSNNENSIVYVSKTVTLHKGQRGFGFVLRGAKGPNNLSESSEKRITSGQLPISLQYLDEIEPGGVADSAGLEKGDFLLSVNGIEVRSAPHERVVTLIRQSGNSVTMTVATPVYHHQLGTGRESDQRLSTDRVIKVTSSSSSSSLSQQRKPVPPPPPRRDPSTTLTLGRTRARSLCIPDEFLDNSNIEDFSSIQYIEEINSDINGIGYAYDGNGLPSRTGFHTTTSNGNISLNSRSQNEDDRVASIRSRGSRRMSTVDLEDFFAKQAEEAALQKQNANEKCTTLRAVKKKKKKKQQQQQQQQQQQLLLQKNYYSTPDIQLELLQRGQLSRWGKSQEDLRGLMYPMAQSETITLKNGKIIKSEELPPRDFKTPVPPTLPCDAKLRYAEPFIDVNDPPSSRHSYTEYKRTSASDIQEKEPMFDTFQQPLSSFKPHSQSSSNRASIAGSVVSMEQERVHHGSEEKAYRSPFIPEPDYSSTDDEADGKKTTTGSSESVLSREPDLSCMKQLARHQVEQSVIQSQQQPQPKSQMLAKRISSESSLTSTASDENMEELKEALRRKALEGCQNWLPKLAAAKLAQSTAHQLESMPKVMDPEPSLSSITKNGSSYRPETYESVKAVKVLHSRLEVDSYSNSSSGVSSDVDNDGSGVSLVDKRRSLTILEKQSQDSAKSNQGIESSQNVKQSIKEEIERKLLGNHSSKSHPGPNTWNDILSAIKANKSKPSTQPGTAKVQQSTSPVKEKQTRVVKPSTPTSINEPNHLPDVLPPPPEFAVVPSSQAVSNHKGMSATQATATVITSAAATTATSTITAASDAIDSTTEKSKRSSPSKTVPCNPSGISAIIKKSQPFVAPKRMPQLKKQPAVTESDEKAHISLTAIKEEKLKLTSVGKPPNPHFSTILRIDNSTKKTIVNPPTTAKTVDQSRLAEVIPPPPEFASPSPTPSALDETSNTQNHEQMEPMIATGTSKRFSIKL